MSNPEIMYKSPESRTVDYQYRDLLERALRHGTTVPATMQGETARMLIAPQLRYEMSNGFPMITERDLSGANFTNALGEHIAFLNGARTQEELESFGCKWWSRWLTKEKGEFFGLEEGEMGGGSYGAAWTDFPLNTVATELPDGRMSYRSEGKGFDQIEHLVRQIKAYPYARTHVITPWVPQFALQHEGLRRNVNTAPCHGTVHVMVDQQNDALNIHHWQRSGDLPVGVPFNMIQYAAFGLMLARLTGFTFDQMVYTFSDAHIYERQYSHVEELISREPKKFGAVVLAPEADGIENIKDFRPEHFAVEGYESHPKMMVPTPV